MASSTGGLFYDPSQQFLGGSAQSLEQMRNQFAAGAQQGAANTADGSQYAQGGLSQLGGVRGSALQAQQYGQGLLGGAQSNMDLGLMGLGQSVDQFGRIANTDLASVAAAQQQRANDVNARQMQAQAAAARGGSQASALRTAQAQGSQNALDTNQSLAALRAQEQQAQVQNRLAAAQYAGQFAQTQIGLGQQQQGFGAGLALNANQQTLAAAQAAAQGGLGLGQLGLGAQGLYTNAGLDANKIQLGSDLDYQSQLAAQAAGKAQFAGGLIGSGAQAIAMMA